MKTDARRSSEMAARASYGRLVAILAARTHDISAAEDALSEAFLAALTKWPEQGVPRKPEAWLLTVAKNRLRNAARHEGVVAETLADLAMIFDETAAEQNGLPDHRLQLLFVCAHPAIDAALRTPLMLQVVLGLNAAQIAAAFLTSPATMSQRLVRVKARIKQEKYPFELPDVHEWSARLDSVLDAIYAIYGVSWDSLPGAGTGLSALGEEALFLCRLLVRLLPDEPEARGLLALILYCEARRQARRNAAGDFVPLDQQDPQLWQRDLLIEAENQLSIASSSGIWGRYQCEAAIQSVHTQRAFTGHLSHQALITLYRLLAERCPGVGVLVSQAAVFLQAGQTLDARMILDALEPDAVKNYQPYWVVLAMVQRVLGEARQADLALNRAIGLTEDPAVRRFLAQQSD